MKKVISMFMTVIIAVTAFVVPAEAATTTLGKPAISRAAASSESSVKLTWKKVDNAEKYIIYYSTQKSEGYKKYSTTSKTTVTVKKLKANTTYYFKLRAYYTKNGKKVYSSYSSPKKCTTKAAEYTGLKITDISSKVQNNNYATISIQGKPNTEYTCSVKYSSKWSEADGLGTKTSDKNGKITWKWKVGARTKAGEHDIRVVGGDETIKTTFVTVK